MKLFDKRPSILLTIAFLLCASVAAVDIRAHRPVNSNPLPCPSVRASSPDSVKTGEEIIFTANVSGGDSHVTPTYNWTVSAGTISSGQGTSSIRVDTTGISSTITATVDVGGYARNCSTSSSSTTSVLAKPEARKIDEYGLLKAEDEQPRLDNFIIELANDPTAKAYVITYGGRNSPLNEAQKRMKVAKDYLLKKRELKPETFTRNLNPSDLVIIDGGYREEPATELWLVSRGAEPPMATPNVDVSEVKPPKVSKKSVKSKTPPKKKTTKKKKS